MPHLQSDAAQHNVSRKLLYLVAGFSIFKQLKPITAYNIPYFVKYKGLTVFEVTNKVVPILSYGTLIFTLLAAPTCEYFSYWTVNHIGNFASLMGSLILRFGNSLLTMQIMEAVSSCGNASFAVFQAYLFFLVTANDFQLLTSINQASLCASLFLASELGQMLVLLGISYNILADISLASGVLTCALGFLLPKDQEKAERKSMLLNFFSRDQGFWSVLKDTWKDKHLQLLSIWWAAAYSGFVLCLNYGTTLFEGISPATEYNGQVIAAGTACATVVALCSVYLAKIMAKAGDAVYIMGSAVYGVLCLTMAFCKSLWTAYLCYIALVSIEKMLICFVYAQCGGLIKNNEYMLLFSFNTGMGWVLTAILQAIFEVTELDIFSEYIALGGYFILIAVLFGIISGIRLWRTYTTGVVSSSNRSSAEASESNAIHSTRQPLIESHNSA